jgi:hypothetical protein
MVWSVETFLGSLGSTCSIQIDKESSEKRKLELTFGCSTLTYNTFGDANVSKISNHAKYFFERRIFLNLSCRSFHVNLTNRCHHRSDISKLVFFMDSTSNSKKKSHIIFFSKKSHFLV